MRPLIGVLLSAIVVPLYAFTNVSGTITASTVWDSAGQPYIVTGQVTVNATVTLTIDSGVTVYFDNNLGINVNGTINATNVLFTSHKDTTGGSPVAASWRCLYVGGTGKITLNKCTIKYAGYYDNCALYFAASATQQSSITNSIIQYSKNALRAATQSKVQIDSTSISNCDWPVEYTGCAVLGLGAGNNFVGNVHNGIIISLGTTNSNLNLPVSPVPYYLNGLSVSANDTLTIGSGNIFKFGQNTFLRIYGMLTAQAASGQQIYFTAYTDDNIGGDLNGDGMSTVPATSYWGGIYFQGGSKAASTMKRCKITYAGYSQSGAVSMDSTSPTIDSCILENNYFGAKLCFGSHPVFSNNSVRNSQQVPVAISFEADPTFIGNDFTFSGNTYDALGLLGGTLTADAVVKIRRTTSIDNLTYVMLSNVTVPAGRKLTINPGVVIKSFGYGFTINGNFSARGKSAADSAIVFTSVRDDQYGNPKDANKDGTQTNPANGDWRGFFFSTSADSTCIFDSCIVKYANYPAQYVGGAIVIDRAHVIVTNSQISNNTHGVCVTNTSAAHVTNNAFANCTSTPIALSVCADPVLTGNTFTNSPVLLGLVGEPVGFSGTVHQKTPGTGYNNITYQLLSMLTINAGTNIAVDSGVVIKAWVRDCGIIVNGGFRTNGTSANRVVLTSLRDDNYGNPPDGNGDGNATVPAKGDWAGIEFTGTCDNTFSRIDNCIIKFADNWWSPRKGSIYCNNGSPVISNCIISDGYTYGIVADGSSHVTVDTVQIVNTEYPIALSLASDPQLNNVTFTSTGINALLILDQTLSSDATLRKKNVAGITNIAYFESNFTIASDATLTIEAGVVVKLDGGIITVNGALHADGTAGQIVFTSQRDDSRSGDANNDGNATIPAKADWGWIDFNSSSRDSMNLLKNCLISYAGHRQYTGEPACSQYGAVLADNARIVIDSCEFSNHHRSAICAIGSASPVITRCLINNTTYTPVTMSMFSNPAFSNNMAQNVGLMALGIIPETYAVDDTIPVRSFAGYDTITYYLYANQNYSVNSGTTITIPAGLTFKGEGTITVNGGLRIEGTAAKPIVFTHTADDLYGTPRDLEGNGSSTKSAYSYYSPLYNPPFITFSDASTDTLCEVHHALFRYKNTSILLQQSSPEIIGCTFQKNYNGVRLNGVSNPVLDSCTFDNLGEASMVFSLTSYPSSTVADSLSGSTYRGLRILDETLAQDVTLIKRTFAGISNIPYIMGTYTVGTSTVLTVAPGVTVKFIRGGTLTIHKGLIARGGSTPDSTIVFTSLYDDYYNGNTPRDTTGIKAVDAWTASDLWSGGYINGWNSIDFENDAIDPQCVFDHCVIRGARCGISMVSASPSISHSAISKNVNGIYLTGASNPVVNYCDIHGNFTYGINNADKSFNIDARYNWWGDSSGPRSSIHRFGVGDTVSDSVNYALFTGTGAANPRMGDVSLNGKIQAYDAALILKHLVGSIILTAVQQRVADVSGTAGIAAFDASLILQYLVDSISTFPSELSKISTIALAAQSFRVDQGLLSLSKKASGGVSFGTPEMVDGTCRVPVVFADVANAVSYDLSISYKGSQLHYLSAADKLGKGLFEANAGGSIIHLCYAGTGMIGASDTVAMLAFSVPGGSSGAALNVERLIINETDLTSKIGPEARRPVRLPESFEISYSVNGAIRYALPKAAIVTLELFTMQGKLVRTIEHGEKQAGYHTVRINAPCGRVLAGGAYFCRMNAGTWGKAIPVIIGR